MIILTHDACILLSGERCYREYPLQWIVRQITDKQATNNNNSDSNSKQQQKPLLKLVETQKFPILYRHSTIVKQINVARNKKYWVVWPIKLHCSSYKMDILDTLKLDLFDQVFPLCVKLIE